MMRSSVVLPEPDGPSSATSRPGRHVEIDVVQRGEFAEALGDSARCRCSCVLLRSIARCAPRGEFAAGAIPAALLTTSVTRASSASSEATANAADEVVFVVQDLDVQRHGVGQAADVPGDHRHRAELAHRARVAEQHAVQQPPADIGQRDAPEGLPAAGAQRSARPPLRRCPAPASAGSVRARRTER